MATKKFDKDKAFKNIVGVPDEGQAPPEPKTEKKAVPAKKPEVKITKKADKSAISSLIKPVEIKSQRTSITLKPSEYEKAQNNAKKLGVSFNEIVNQLIEKFNQDIG